MQKTFTKYKLKPNKDSALKKWGKELMRRYDEALITLEEENIIMEWCLLLSNDEVVFGVISDGKIKPSDQTKDINRQHRATIKDCLTQKEVIGGGDLNRLLIEEEQLIIYLI